MQWNSGNHTAFLDLRKAYEKFNRRLLVERCFVIRFPNTPRMVQSSLSEVILRTVSNVTNPERPPLEGVVQGINISSPLFNIFIDPLPQATRNLALQDPRNQIFADDVTFSFQIIALLERIFRPAPRGYVPLACNGMPARAPFSSMKTSQHSLARSRLLQWTNSLRRRRQVPWRFPQTHWYCPNSTRRTSNQSGKIPTHPTSKLHFQSRHALVACGVPPFNICSILKYLCAPFYPSFKGPPHQREFFTEANAYSIIAPQNTSNKAAAEAP